MQIFTLDSEIEPKNVEGQLIKVHKHEIVKGAYTYEFKSKKKKLFITAFGGKLQEVTYDCSGFFPWSKSGNRKKLLEYYDTDKNWIELFNNRAGCMLQNSEETQYATWERKSSNISFGVMLFREEMQRAVN